MPIFTSETHDLLFFVCDGVMHDSGDPPAAVTGGDTPEGWGIGDCGVCCFCPSCVEHKEAV